MKMKSESNDPLKIGLLGGSFNPLHIGHLRLCVEILEQGGVDRVQLVPAYVPPHKDIKNILPFEMRCAMIESAIKDFAEVSINPLEKERPGPSYTYDTLKILTRTEPEARFTFIMGDNDLLTMPKWYKGMEIAFMSDLIIAGREDSDLNMLDEFISGFWDVRKQAKDVWRVNKGGRLIRYFTIPGLDISSSMVRSRWLAGKSIRWLVPDQSGEYLNLYRAEVDRIWHKTGG